MLSASGPFSLDVWSGRFGEAEAGDFDFEAAVLGVVVFADTIGEVDGAARLEVEFLGTIREVPSNGFDRRHAGKKS